MTTPVLIVPGINNSGASHWQTIWERSHPGFERLAVEDWDHPDSASWSDAIGAAMRRLGPRTVIVAHSLGCLAVAHWAAREGSAAAAALLVALPDPQGPAFPPQALGFSPVPETRFPFPSIIVESGDDPYANPPFTQRCARDWGSKVHQAGNHGHLNAASGLGAWPAGWALFESLAR
ncbi:alpha/beta hydrolase [Pseudoduganella sp. LjRoot289]|uniref:RBBP9/YdeN family alpha/beta hydrolase n=1 Tax=Pseudoduganella sp. LjRoot289 TaxID=3342314 RepID=UPI003ECD54C3